MNEEVLGRMADRNDTLVWPDKSVRPESDGAGKDITGSRLMDRPIRVLIVLRARAAIHAVLGLRPAKRRFLRAKSTVRAV